jgi:hypothetical protein
MMNAVVAAARKRGSCETAAQKKRYDSHASNACARGFKSKCHEKDPAFR